MKIFTLKILYPSDNNGSNTFLTSVKCNHYKLDRQSIVFYANHSTGTHIEQKVVAVYPANYTIIEKITEEK